MVVFWCLDADCPEMVVFCCSGIDSLGMTDFDKEHIICVGKFSGMFFLVFLVDTFLAVVLLLLLCLLCTGLGLQGLKIVLPDLG